MDTITWTLIGLGRGHGTCDHCGRTLTTLFRIRNTQGHEMTVGRAHAKQYTGWTPSLAEARQAEQREAAKVFRAEFAAEHPLLAMTLAKMVGAERAAGNLGGPAADLDARLTERPWKVDQAARHVCDRIANVPALAALAVAA